MSLQIWLPLIDDLENKGLSDLTTFTSEGFSANTSGKIGKCYSGWGIFHLEEEILTESFSIATWVRSTGYGKYNDMIACKNVDGVAHRFYLSIYNGSKLHFNVNGTAANGNSREYSFETDIWYHIAATYDGSVSRIYVNGVMIQEQEEPDAYREGMTNLCVGCRSSNEAGTSPAGSNSNTSYNDFRIYDHCLSEKEVKELSKGLVAHYPLNDFVGNPNLIPRSLASEENLTYATSSTAHVTVETKDGYTYYKCGNGVDSSGTSVLIRWGDSIKIKANTTYTYSAWLKVNKAAAFNFTSYGHFQVYNASSTKSDKTHEDIVAERVYVPSTLEENKWTKVSITFTTNDLANSIFRVYPKYNYGGTTVVCIRDQKLEEGSVATPWIPAETAPLYSELGLDDTTIYDTSGYGHNGAVSANPPTVAVDSPRYSSCAEFNGTDNTIDLGVDTWLPTDAITVSLWAYKDDWTNVGTNCKTLSCTQSGGWNFEQGTGGGYRFSVYKEGLTYAYSTPVKKWADYAPGWHLITGTFDKYVSKIYIDGEFDSVSSNASPTVEALIHYNANTHLFIGCEAATANPSAPYFNGKISDVRIYCTALSPEDIKELYEVSASVDNKGNVYAHEYIET